MSTATADAIPAVPTPATQDQLSIREVEVMALASQGMNNQEIAEKLVLSPHTVKTHLVRIYRKLGVHSRTEATTEAIRRGLITPQAEGIGTATTLGGLLTQVWTAAANLAPLDRQRLVEHNTAAMCRAGILQPESPTPPQETARHEPHPTT